MGLCLIFPLSDLQMIPVVLKIKTPRKASCIYPLLIIFLKDKIFDTLRGQMLRLNDINKLGTKSPKNTSMMQLLITCPGKEQA